MTQYNILRTKKLKDNTSITNAVEHNLRLREQANIDSNKSHLNQVLINSLDSDLSKSSSFQTSLNNYYEKLGIKPKVDNVKCLEFVVTASPEFFQGKSTGEINQWAQKQVEFFKKEFDSNLKFGVLHLDEKTPHIHFFVSTELKSVKKYKNQKGEFFKETWGLNAKRFNPEFLRTLHSKHAEHNQEFGLKRGIKNSSSKHEDLKSFYSGMDEVLSDKNYVEDIEKFIQSLDSKNLEKELKTRIKPTFIALAEKLHTVKNYLVQFKQFPKLLKKLDKDKKEVEERFQEVRAQERRLNSIKEIEQENSRLKIENNELSKDNKKLIFQNQSIKEELRKYRPEIFTKRKFKRLNSRLA